MQERIKQVVVMGGAGYLGGILCARLVNREFEVVSIDDSATMRYAISVTILPSVARRLTF